MELEKQVCSVELAKKLKELGIKQESLFYWGRYLHHPYNVWELGDISDFEDCNAKYISAFTVAELGDMIKDWSIPFYHPINKWVWTCNGFVINEQTEADARAQMLIYIIENKLIDVKEG